MLAYIFIIEGVGEIASYASVAGYMQAHGVDGRLLPLVILTGLCSGLLVLFGLKTRWAANALFGFCLLTALFFHSASDQVIELQKNVAMAGGFLAPAICGPALGRWTPGAVEPARVSRPQNRLWSTQSGRRLHAEAWSRQDNDLVALRAASVCARLELRAARCAQERRSRRDRDLPNLRA